MYPFWLHSFFVFKALDLNILAVLPMHELKYLELTEKIIGCSMKVHRHFGPGFPEIVYKRALMIELEKIDLSCKQEVERDIIY